jgi:predicted nucleic-acid-binding Zn-ribbon protein
MKCPKCDTRSDFYRHWIAKGLIEVMNGVVLVGECMARTCPICGYTFAEPTQDQGGLL